jgi:AraC-like DNA-binding protein
VVTQPVRPLAEPGADRRQSHRFPCHRLGVGRAQVLGQHLTGREVERRSCRLGGGRQLTDVDLDVHCGLAGFLPPGVAVAVEPRPQRVVVVDDRLQRRGKRRMVDILGQVQEERHREVAPGAVGGEEPGLVGVSRLAADVVDDCGRTVNRCSPRCSRPSSCYPRPLSLRDVAAAVNISPGHLTSTVRRQTGRTVQQWITERWMVQARRLLAATELPIGEVGRRSASRTPTTSPAPSAKRTG